MTIDIRGVNTHNKGAQLMMYSIAERIGNDFSLSASPNGTDYLERAKLGLKQTLLINQAPTLSASASNLIPKKIRTAFGLASDSDLTGVLDAAGFAYSDNFSAERSKREATHAARWKKNGVPLVMLPQAFGPFTHSDQREWSGKLLRDAKIVFARDKISLQHVRSLDPAINVKLSPDFTIGLKAPGIEPPIGGVYGAIVPNSKMVSHTSLSAESYVESLVNASLVMRAAGIEPVVVIHEFNDLALGRRISESLGCEMFQHENPLVLKKALGDAAVAVASRFHAIVGALSQETPVIAYGWSHKYQELLSDFGVPEWVYTPEQDIKASVEQLIHAANSPNVLAERGTELRSQNDAMWTEVVASLTSR
jgi:hypothetical protein